MGFRTERSGTTYSSSNYNAALNAEDTTYGRYFVIHALGSVIWGARFWHPDYGSPKTWTILLWEPGNDTAIATKQIAISASSPGFYTVEFDDNDKVEIGAAELSLQNGASNPWDGYYCIGLRDNDGMHSIHISRGDPFANYYANQGFAFNQSHGNYYTSGNAKPKTSIVNKPPLDVIVYGYSDEDTFTWTQGSQSDSLAIHPLRATAEVLGEELYNLRGYAKTRLKGNHAAGATVLNVESTLGLEPSGVVLVENERVSKTYSGIDQTQGAQKITGVDALEYDHNQGDEVLDWNRKSSRFDKLRRALLIDYADGQDLDRVTQLETDRPRGFSDSQYRTLSKVLGYLHRGPIYAFELVLDAVYPGGGWSIYESLVEEPGVIYITIPGSLGSDEDGRTYMNARFLGNSDTAAQVTVDDTPTSVESIKTQPFEAELLMGVLPSADTPAWTYVAESSGAEGTYFAVANGVLTQTMPNGTDCGKYELSIPELAEYASVEIWWKPGTLTTVAGYPWMLGIEMSGREIVVIWDDSDMYLGQFDETTVAGPISVSTGWHGIRLVIDNYDVKLYLNNQPVLQDVIGSFAASSNNKITFGYIDNGHTNDWDVDWDNFKVYAKNSHNFWNLALNDGSLATSSDILTTVSTWFVVGDVGKLIWTNGDNAENYGLWTIVSRPSTSTVQLDGVIRSDGYTNSLTPDRFYSRSSRFCSLDAGKTLTISTGGANDDTYPVLSVIDSKEVKLDTTAHGAGLVTEADITWKFTPNFVTESSIPWELVDAGTNAAAVLTLHGGVTLPQATQPVDVQYTTVKSAQLLLDENEENAGSGARYPFYLFGVNERIQKIIQDVSAAGVIPKFFIGY
jgi:hypothetical protein